MYFEITCSAIAKLDVRPGDSMPNKFTSPFTPWTSSPCTKPKTNMEINKSTTYFIFFFVFIVLMKCLRRHRIELANFWTERSEVQRLFDVWYCFVWEKQFSHKVALRIDDVRKKCTWTMKSSGAWPRPEILGLIPEYPGSRNPSFRFGKYFLISP